MPENSARGDTTVLITGATAGIGRHTAAAIASKGARVIVTGRNRARGEDAVEDLRRETGNDHIDLLLGDLSTRAGIESIASQVLSMDTPLDVLVNNAGHVASTRELTSDGIESTLAVNAIAPVLLTRLLLPALARSSAGRVVSVSGGRHPKRIDMDNLQGERSFVGLTAYSHSKVVMMAAMRELASELAGTDITVNVCYPGSASTAMTQGVTTDMVPFAMRLMWPLFKRMGRPDSGKSAAKASRSSVWLASSSEAAGLTDAYADRNCTVIDWPAAVADPIIRASVLNVIDELSHTSGRPEQGGAQP